MVKSMTGFGRGEYTDGKRTITMEMKAVNHRYCEVSVRLSRRYSFAEEYIRSIVKETVRRGKIEITAQVENLTEEDSIVKLNMIVAKQYYENLTELKQNFELSGDISLETLALMPDVMKPVPDASEEEELLNCFKEATRIAASRFNEMRSIEGEKLAEDILMRGDLIRNYAAEIEKFAPDIVKSYSDKLRERIGELLDGNVEIPEDRIAVEAAFFADKINITEEIVRLRSHLDQLSSIISEKAQPNGKKLDFLVQELNREANTIGSKANDSRITNYVLEMKSEVEKIREQVQNIE